MIGLVAVTDHDWFEFLRQRTDLDEVNFWRPSDTRTPRQLIPGTPLFFKLRKQHGGWVVGYGVFARHSVLPAWLAWETFEEKNGAASFSQMRERIERLRRSDARDVREGDYSIGCLMLSQPVFFEREDWIRPPSDWPENAVQGKAYDLNRGEGARIWQDCQAASPVREDEPRVAEALNATGERFGPPMLIRPRLGQGTFRIAVTEAYGRSCAITSEHSLPVLEAAHIRPYAEGGAHETSNGLLLRSDIHRLFDRGYVGVTPAYRFTVSPKLKEEFANGRTYYPLEGNAMHVPAARADLPDPRLLEWHMDEKFRR